MKTALTPLSRKKNFRALSELWTSFRDFVREDFHPRAYLLTFLLILTLIFLNYRFDLYGRFMRPAFIEGSSMWMMPLAYCAIYFAACLPAFLIGGRTQLLHRPAFVLKSLFVIAVYGFAVGFYAYYQLDFDTLFQEERLYLIRLFSQLKVLIFLLLPFLLMKRCLDPEVEGLYGLSRNTRNIRGYLFLFLALLPFLVLASGSSDFLRAYPQFRPWYYGEVFGMPIWVSTALFEVVYALDFVMVELVFRGVLVIGMIRLLGSRAVLPMVALYATIHFGKPLGETLSSIFGGYILGAFAYQTKHIWGGVIVHILIALSMEFMGLWHFYKI